MNLLSELFALHKKRTPPAEATLKDTVHVKTSGSGETGCYVSMLWLGVQHHLHELEHGPQIGRQDGKAHTHTGCMDGAKRPNPASNRRSWHTKSAQRWEHSGITRRWKFEPLETTCPVPRRHTKTRPPSRPSVESLLRLPLSPRNQGVEH